MAPRNRTCWKSAATLLPTISTARGTWPAAYLCIGYATVSYADIHKTRRDPSRRFNANTWPVEEISCKNQRPADPEVSVLTVDLRQQVRYQTA